MTRLFLVLDLELDSNSFGKCCQTESSEPSHFQNKLDELSLEAETNTPIAGRQQAEPEPLVHEFNYFVRMFVKIARC